MELKWKKYFFAFFIGGMLLLACTQKTQAKNLIVVLDPGHDSVHAGARGNNLREEYLNLRIALACKQELELYEGVSVFMIREGEVCPYGGSAVGDSVKCNVKRVEFAKSVGADVYVSLHNNSSSSTSAHGVGVYYPTTNYNAYCGNQGSVLADSILAQLAPIGLYNRGKTVRYSEDNSRYPDGSLADYYAIIKRNKLNGIPAVIVEHAFVSNYNDATQFLGSEDKLQRLGALDAVGIANCYGLQKKIDFSHAVISAYESNGKKVFRMQAANIRGTSNLRFAVWSEAGGQDDLAWYFASQDAYGNWVADVAVANHRTAGKYIVHAYVNQDTFIGETSFQIGAPSAESSFISAKDDQKGVFELSILGAHSDVEIDKVDVAIWKKADMSDLRWLASKKTGEGNYSLTAGIEQLGYEYGDFYVRAYVRDVNGISSCVFNDMVQLVLSEPQLSVKETSVSTVYEVQAENVSYGAGLEVVELQVQQDSEEGTAAVYKALKEEDGRWKGYVVLPRSGEADSYLVQVYAVLKNSQKVFLGDLYLQVPNARQDISAVQEPDGSYLWKGTDVWVNGDTLPEKSLLKLNPYSDYAALSHLLEEDDKNLYGDFIAYDLAFEEEASSPASGDAVDAVTPNAVTVDVVTADAVTAESVQAQTATVTMVIPEHMRDKELVVLQIERRQAVQATPAAVSGEPLEMSFIMSENKETLSFTAVPEGTFVLAERQLRKKGDANENGKVELKDAQMALRYVLHLTQLSERAQKYCDVDGDEKITLHDVKIILRAALGIIIIS